MALHELPTKATQKQLEPPFMAALSTFLIGPESGQKCCLETQLKQEKNGGADGTRTRDLRRDRPAF